MRHRRVRRRLAAAILVGLPVVTGACSASAPSPPTGVDGLEIPTPEPDPADFTDVVDNPWLPLPVGKESEYVVTDDSGDHRLQVTVAAGPKILGVPTTTVHREPVGKEPTLPPSTDYYAQDRDGNVWWFGREGAWRAGENGAQAGLAMPAEPRVGDGFRMAVAPGIDVRAEVADLDRDTGRLQLDVHSGEHVREELYAEGVGLTQLEIPGLGMTMGLAASDEPQNVN